MNGNPATKVYDGFDGPITVTTRPQPWMLGQFDQAGNCGACASCGGDPNPPPPPPKDES